MAFSNLLAVSAREAWVVQYTSGEDDWSNRLVRYRAGEWKQVGPDTDSNVCPPVLASDGAVWTTRSEGLVRASGDSLRVIAKGVAVCPELAGPDGSVWLVEGSEISDDDDRPDGDEDRVVRFKADGTRIDVGRPKGFAVACFQAAGADGSAWVTGGAYEVDEEGHPCPGEGESIVDPGKDLARWNGRRWIRVTEPRGLLAMVVSEGKTWAAASAGDGFDWYRFDRDAWTKVAHDAGGPPSEDENFASPWPVLAAPGGGACGQSWVDSEEEWDDWEEDEDSAPGIFFLACVSATGEVSRVGAPSAGILTGFEEISIGTDGSVWVLGPTGARLLEVLPTDG